MNKLPDIALTREEYEEFIYTIREHYPSIQTSTLVVIMISSQEAEVVGDLLFNEEIRLEVTDRYQTQPRSCPWPQFYPTQYAFLDRRDSFVGIADGAQLSVCCAL